MSTPVIVRSIPENRQFALPVPTYPAGNSITRAQVLSAVEDTLTLQPDRIGNETPAAQQVKVFPDFSKYLAKRGTIILFVEGVAKQYILPKGAGTPKPAVGVNTERQWKSKPRGR